MSPELPNIISQAIALHISGNLQDALTYYNAALTLDNRNRLVLFNLGCLFEEAGYAEEAETMFVAAKAVCDTDGIKGTDIIKAVREHGKRGVN